MTRRALDALVRMSCTDDLGRTRHELGEFPEAEVASLIECARAHGVEAWLAACAPAVDGPWSELSTQRGRFLAARARALTEAQAFGARLDAMGCPWAVLKGLAISQTAYPRPDLRHALDLDILIPPARFEEVVRSAVASGYGLLDVNWPLLAERMPGQLRLRSPNGTLIDLHWSALNQRRQRDHFDVSTEHLLASATALSGPALRVLAPADQLVHAALHATLAGANRLLWLVDVDRIVRTGPDWDQVVARARAASVGLPVSVTLRRARVTLGTAVSDAVLRRLAAGRAWPGLQRVVDSRGVLAPDPSRPAVAPAFARSSQRDARTSLVAFLRHGLSWVRSGAPRSRPAASWLDPGSDTSALHPVADASARAAYFASVDATQ